MHRIHDFIITDKAEIASMFRPFDSSLTILDFSLMKESMSNTGYAVTTNAGKYSLKLYSNTTDKPETAALTYLKNKINVPALFFYDGSRRRRAFASEIRRSERLGVDVRAGGGDRYGDARQPCEIRAFGRCCGRKD